MLSYVQISFNSWNTWQISQGLTVLLAHMARPQEFVTQFDVIAGAVAKMSAQLFCVTPKLIAKLSALTGYSVGYNEFSIEFFFIIYIIF